MFDRNILIEHTDPELFAAIKAENRRQEQHIELIASHAPRYFSAARLTSPRE